MEHIELCNVYWINKGIKYIHLECKKPASWQALLLASQQFPSCKDR